MGHYLDPLLDPIKSKFSQDIQDAHHDGLKEGAEYVQHLIVEFCRIPLNVGQNRTIDVDDLMDFIRSRPII